MRRRGSGIAILVLALALAGGLVGGYLALGGADRWSIADAATSDPCVEREPVEGGGSGGEVEAARILLTSLDGAACALGVPREDLLLALGREPDLASAAATLGVPEARLEEAVLGSIADAVAAEEAAGTLPPLAGTAIDLLLRVVPANQLLAAVRGDEADCLDPTWVEAGTLDEVAAQIAVFTGLYAACDLGIAPLEAVAALADPTGIDGLADRSGRSVPEVEEVVRADIERAVTVATDAGALSATEGSVLGAAARVAPVDRLLAIVRGDDDPCEPFGWPGSASRGEALAAIALIGVVDAACALDAPTFDVFAALADEQELLALEQETGRTRGEIEAALQSGLERGVAEAQEAGAISGIEALLLRAVLGQVGILDLLGNLVG